MSFTMKRNNFAQEALRVRTQEVAEWVKNTLKLDFSDSKDDVKGFWDAVQTGTMLCQLAEKCSPASTWKEGNSEATPDVPCPHNSHAKPGSFHARDNIANFLESCKKLGVPPIMLFSPDDIFSRKNDKMIVNTLLELSRIGVKNGITPPLIIQYEMELDKIAKQEFKEEEADEEEDINAEKFQLTTEELDAIRDVYDKLAPDPTHKVSLADMLDALILNDAIKELCKKSERLATLLNDADTKAPDEPADLGDFLLWLTSNKHEQKESSEVTTRPRGGSRFKPRFKYLPYLPAKGDDIDVALAEVINKNELDIRIRKVQIKKKKKARKLQGAYRIGDNPKKIYMRLVRGLLMVRVGHNWEGVLDYMRTQFADAKDSDGISAIPESNSGDIDDEDQDDD